jgi:hypothetical protein
MGGYFEGDGKTRNAHQREAAEFLFEGVNVLAICSGVNSTWAEDLSP